MIVENRYGRPVTLADRTPIHAPVRAVAPAPKRILNLAPWTVPEPQERYVRERDHREVSADRANTRVMCERMREERELEREEARQRATPMWGFGRGKDKQTSSPMAHGPRRVPPGRSRWGVWAGASYP